MAKIVISFEPDYDDILRNNEKVSVEQSDEFFDKYYFLYEYSDEINVIRNESLYPSMINYVKTGILTKEEMVEAIAFK